MKKKIKTVVSISQQGNKELTVGCNEIAEIKDNSLEYENYIHVQFDAYDKKGKLKGTFINGAIVVEYF